ncbi:acyloxyacyl hydrolase [Rhizobium helianthi]|uniref:Acyloxyacyl hydrolase n=1 Tax=Rhizobium helianthi TaxID=1132695 RepID=A0ABW4LY36_9HYPH
MQSITGSNLFRSLAAATFMLIAHQAQAADTASAGGPLEKPIFDEARFGALVAADKTYTNDEKGAFISGMVFFDPWDHNNAQGFEKFIRPRIHVGGDISTAGEANQVYAGFSWTVPLGQYLFVEAGFGGSLNDGKLEMDGGRGPFLGCHTLFHEYVAAGVNITENWRVVGTLSHSSHANLCGEPNNGLTRGGVMVGYKF